MEKTGALGQNKGILLQAILLERIQSFVWGLVRCPFLCIFYSNYWMLGKISRRKREGDNNARGNIFTKIWKKGV
jgi:hypothetical protein